MNAPAPPMLSAADIPIGKRVTALGFVLIAYFCYAWSWNTVDILRPYIKESAGLSLAQSGSLYTLQSAGALVGAIVMGQVADTIGRRNALMIAMFGFGSALLAGIAVFDFTGLVVQRFALGFFMGSMFPITVGIYSGLFAKQVRGRIAGVVMGTYNLAVAALGFVSSAAFGAGLPFQALLWIGVVPVSLALLAFWVVPDDRRLIPMDGAASGPVVARGLPIAQLFRPAVVRQTLLLTLMTGLNFFAYQAFTGWATTYLKTERGIPDTVIGDVLGWQFVGAAIGGFLWGWVGDRYGRRAAAWGFVAAAALIPAYLFLDLPFRGLQLVGFAYGFMLSASVVWGPWLSELYPPHLRSTAASIFNWGRIISMTAPLITAPLAEQFGLAPVMCLASVSFLAAALIWRSLPETLGR